MKKVLFLILTGAFTLASCEKIPKGERIKQTGVSCGECEISPDDEFITQKAVLLEEFTGTSCTNCPEGAAEGKSLVDQYPDQLFLVAIHAGNFAVPNESKGLPADFRTQEGTEIYDWAKPLGVPSAIIDRNDYGTAQFSKFYQGSGWANEVDDILSNTSVADMGLIAEVETDESSRTVCLTTKFKAVADVSEKDLYWSAYLVESGIVAPQLDGGNKREDYVHNHVLRTTFNSTFGTPIPEFDGAVDAVSCDSRQLVLDEEWVLENCNIVVFVYDRNTYEVLQTIETNL